MSIAELRRDYHREIVKHIVRVSNAVKGGKDYPNFADGSLVSSIDIAWGILHRIQAGDELAPDNVPGQRAGRKFEDITKSYLQRSVGLLQHLRPGEWSYAAEKSLTEISRFDQYHHLAHLAQALHDDPGLAAALGANSDYLITPDIVITRQPVSDEAINLNEFVVESWANLARYTRLRAANHEPILPILHASISCKWTIRSDRAQNTRAEALNLIRNRKGRLPHIVAVTAEPLPTRLASIALGTGDLDCVYHFALHEMIETLKDLNKIDQLDMLDTMLQGNRLRDISDLPFDLAI